MTRFLLSLFLLVPLGLISSTVLPVSTTTFTLYDNGASTGGVPITLSSLDFESGVLFAEEMSTRIDVSKYGANGLVLADRSFREDGELITSFEQLLPDNSTQRRVYLVAQDLEFVWPFIELHHRQRVSPKVLQSPTLGQDVVVESLSEVPRVFRILNMFTVTEATAIIDFALNKTGETAIKRSTVGTSDTDSGRTSQNAWDWESPSAKDMIQRSFQLSNIQADDAKRDGLQVVRYTQGQGYNTHPDYFQGNGMEDGEQHEEGDFLPAMGGTNRFATVFMYLNTVEEGGYTVFPWAPGIVPPREPPEEGLALFQQGSWERTVLKQCYSKLAVPAVAGTAALFYSITPDGQLEPQSHHAACPLTEGLKWGANIWIWNKQRFGEIRTGESRAVKVVNQTPYTVFITWEGQDNGVVNPGQLLQFNTFEYHRFKASYGSHKHKPLSYFTVKDNNDVWEIQPPRHDDHNHDGSRQLRVSNRLEDQVVLVHYQGNVVTEVRPGTEVTLNVFVGHTFQSSLSNDNDHANRFEDSYEVNNYPNHHWKFDYDDEDNVVGGKEDLEPPEKDKIPEGQLQLVVHNEFLEPILLYFDSHVFHTVPPGEEVSYNVFKGNKFVASLGSLEDSLEEFVTDDQAKQVWKILPKEKKKMGDKVEGARNANMDEL